MAITKRDRKERKREASRRFSCPVCDEGALVPILYGPLPESLDEDRERGNLFWGGLSMRRGSPRWKCASCHRSFGKDRDEPRP